MKVNFDELILRPDQSYWYGEKPFSGTAYYLREDGSCESEVEFVDGVQEGRFWDLSADGLIESEGQIRNGVYHGEVISWYPDGSMRKREDYEHGVLKSLQEWSADGALIREETVSEANEQLLQELRAAHIGALD